MSMMLPSMGWRWWAFMSRAVCRITTASTLCVAVKLVMLNKCVRSSQSIDTKWCDCFGRVYNANWRCRYTVMMRGWWRLRNVYSMVYKIQQIQQIQQQLIIIQKVWLSRDGGHSRHARSDDHWCWKAPISVVVTLSLPRISLSIPDNAWAAWHCATLWKISSQSQGTSNVNYPYWIVGCTKNDEQRLSRDFVKTTKISKSTAIPVMPDPAPTLLWR